MEKWRADLDPIGWLAAIWGSRYIEVDISLVSMAVTLWMGLYLLRRGAGTPVGLLSGACALLLSLIYAFEALQDVPGISAHKYELLLRAQGVVVPIPIAIWVGLAYLIKNNVLITTSVKRVWAAVAVIGASQVWLRAFTNWHYDYAHIYHSPFYWQDWWTPEGPGFITFAVLVLAALLWSMYNIFRPFYDEAGSWRRMPEVEQFWPLFVGMCLFITSMVYMMLAYVLNIEAPETIGLVGVTLGVVALGFGVFWHNSLIERGRDITIDFPHSVFGVGGVLALLGLIIHATNATAKLGIGAVVFIVATIVAIASSAGTASSLLDALLDRAGTIRWTPGYRQRLEELLLAQEVGASRGALRTSLTVQLSQLCRDISTNRGFVALQNGEGFEVQAIYGQAINDVVLESIVSLADLPLDGIPPIPFDRQVGDLKGMGIIVPLWVRDRRAGVIVLGEKRYDEGELKRIVVVAEAMQHAIEAAKGSEQVGELKQKLERLQRLEKPDISGEDERKLLAICARSGLKLNDGAEIINAARAMLEGYYDFDALENSPFIKCSLVRSRLAQSRGRSDALALLREEIARTIAAMKPSGHRGNDWRRWVYLDHRFIKQYDEKGDRYTAERIAAELRVSRRTIARNQDKFVRDFILAFLDPHRTSVIS